MFLHPTERGPLRRHPFKLCDSAVIYPGRGRNRKPARFLKTRHRLANMEERTELVAGLGINWEIVYFSSQRRERPSYIDMGVMLYPCNNKDYS